MQVILITDDKKLGKRHDIIEVANSYANNVLIPKKIVVPATKENLTRRNNQIIREQQEFESKVAEAKKLSELITELGSITIKVESKNGKMFGAITSKDISAELAKYDLIVDKREIILDKPIKSVSSTDVIIKLFNGISATIKVVVEPR